MSPAAILRWDWWSVTSKHEIRSYVGTTHPLADRLRIYQPKFAVEVSKITNTLTVTDAGKFFKRYRVGTGQFSKTPVGEFKITTRIEGPPWHRGDGKTIPPLSYASIVPPAA